MVALYGRQGRVAVVLPTLVDAFRAQGQYISLVDELDRVIDEIGPMVAE